MTKTCRHGAGTVYWSLGDGRHVPEEIPKCMSPATARYRYDVSDPGWWGYVCEQHTPASSPDLTVERMVAP